MTTIKEYTEAKLKELQTTAVKDQVTDFTTTISRDNEDREVAAKFYAAIASKNWNKIEESNALVEKQYKAKGQEVGTIGSGTAGGVLVPTTVADSIVMQLVNISPMRQISRVISNMPAQLSLPSDTTRVTADWTAEGASITESSAAFAPNLLTPHELAGRASFTAQVIRDAATTPDLQKVIEDEFAEALALKENDAFVNGDGSDKPFGFRSVAITPLSTAQVGATLAYTDVTRLYYTLPTAYRNSPDSMFVTSSAGAQALTNLRDTQGQPIWRNGLADGNPPTILNKPVYIVDEIPANLGAGTNATELWFGTFKRNYFIGDRDGLAVDYGTNADDFARNKISLRVVKYVAGRPIHNNAFAKLTGVIAS